MNCRNAEELLPLYSGGDLPSEKVSALEAHLGSCAECVSELETCREAISALSELHEAAPASSLWDSLAPRLKAQDAVRKIHTPWFRRPFWVSTAAAALLLIAGRSVFRPAQVTSNQESLASNSVPSTEAPTPGLVPVPREELDQLLRNHAVMMRQNDSSAVLVQQASNTPVEF
ncbi:MAG: zf-HC2 domain-containing protein [Planctomycetota bacterium]|jgi:anti-sigma factor RsiW|nr:zf-HC2 domain-containing protein [Planctomycetota bacterium]